MNEPAFPGLSIVNLKRESAAVREAYKNVNLLRINRHCIRMAVMEGEYPWHRHPHSDECFMVIEGALEIDLADGRTIVLSPGELFMIPAGVTHRTRARHRSVNLCFEDARAHTDAIFEGPGD